MVWPLAIAALGLQTMGAVNSANASRSQARIDRAVLEFQASTNENNAILAEFRAVDAIRRGQIEQARLRRTWAQRKGAARVSAAGRGVATGSASVLDILGGAEVIEAADSLTLEENARRESFAHLTDALNSRTAAEGNRIGAQGISPSSAFNTTLLAGASQVAGSATSMYGAGMFG